MILHGFEAADHCLDPGAGRFVLLQQDGSLGIECLLRMVEHLILLAQPFHDTQQCIEVLL